jgi:hypothetical protein|tara:strand:- start:206 stop:457 length:252 start_codon:yes stop_codon:yes gene_type:complete
MIRYTPSPVPDNTEDIPAYLRQEFERMSGIINNIADGHFDVSNVAPDKPRTGDIRYADGSNWNPGSTGEGVYIYLSTGAWSKL